MTKETLTDKLEQTENTKKFTEEEMKEIKAIQEKYVSLQRDLGQLSIARIRMEQQIEEMNDAEEKLIAAFKKTQEDEKKFIDKVTEKYGEGTLDPQTGTFTPNK